jgi:hypothetical protein
MNEYWARGVSILFIFGGDSRKIEKNTLRRLKTVNADRGPVRSSTLQEMSMNHNMTPFSLLNNSFTLLNAEWH